MARWWWRGDGWENLFFKRVPTGWVFQTSGLWLFGRRRYYLVSDSKMAEFIARYEKLYWRHVAMGVAFILAGMTFGFFWLVPMRSSVLPAILLVSIVTVLLMNACIWWTLRPLLVGLPPTTERIAWDEQLRAWAAVVPRQELIICTILLAVLFALAAYSTLASSGWDIDGLIAAPLLGIAVVYCVALLNAKRKITAGPWS